MSLRPPGVASMQEPLLSWFLLAGRICLSMVYLVSGVHKGIYFQKAVVEFQDARVPLARIAVIATVVLHVGAAACLITGLFVVESALALAAFTLVASWRVHDFWNLPDGPQRLLQSRFALAHLAVVGGLLVLAATGPGSIALAP